MSLSLAHFGEMKRRGEKIAVLTAYDYPTARLLSENGVDLLLVGDSLGMVVLGFPDTTEVTMEHMIHHTRAVARAAGSVPILADLPFGSVETADSAVNNARQLIDAGAIAVKLEGGASHAGQIRALVEAGIPVMAHIGMMPQRVRVEGGYKIKGRSAEEAERLLVDAHAVESAGAFAILLELVLPAVAARITAAVQVPTIGIGSGTQCDGQVLVTHDLIGLFPWFTPKFVSPRADVAEAIRTATRAFVRETKAP